MNVLPPPWRTITDISGANRMPLVGDNRPAWNKTVTEEEERRRVKEEANVPVWERPTRVKDDFTQTNQAETGTGSSIGVRREFRGGVDEATSVYEPTPFDSERKVSSSIWSSPSLSVGRMDLADFLTAHHLTRILPKLRLEGINSIASLAYMSERDWREVGLSMAERSRLRQILQAQMQPGMMRRSELETSTNPRQESTTIETGLKSSPTKTMGRVQTVEYDARPPPSSSPRSPSPSPPRFHTKRHKKPTPPAGEHKSTERTRSDKIGNERAFKSMHVTPPAPRKFTFETTR